MWVCVCERAYKISEWISSSILKFEVYFKWNLPYNLFDSFQVAMQKEKYMFNDFNQSHIPNWFSMLLSS